MEVCHGRSNRERLLGSSILKEHRPPRLEAALHGKKVGYWDADDTEPFGSLEPIVGQRPLKVKRPSAILPGLDTSVICDVRVWRKEPS